MAMNEAILRKFKSVIKDEGLKLTPQRVAVFEEVCSSDTHRESEEIYIALKNKNNNVSRATVYRTMDLLYEHELVQRMDIGDGKWRYEHWLDCSHHDHIICIRCGDIVEFTNDRIEKLQKDICDTFDYQLIRHIHQLFGFCKSCQKIEKSK